MSAQHRDATTHDEVELKYAVDEDFVLPELDGLDAEARTARLEALYFDTPGQRLAAARVTLRRRTGGDDAGWHLKLPVAGARREVRLPLGRATRKVPAQLAGTVRALTRGEPLVPVAQLTTERTVRHVVDDGGRVMAEVADDRVQARRLLAEGPAAEPDTWRELEVELVEGGAGLLRSLDAQLRAHGLSEAPHGSKLARALGTGAEAPAPAALKRSSPAGEVVRAHLAAQVHQITSNDPLVRLDVPDSVHKARVATRRLRSALKTYRPLFAEGVPERLREELSWLADELGGARDAEVMRDRLVAAVGELEPVEGEDPAAAATALREVMEADYRAAHEELLRALDGERYAALLKQLDELVEAPLDDGPWSPVALERAKDVLPAMVRATDRKLRKRVRSAYAADADPSVPAADADELFHDARKRAKEARYAGESLVPLWGEEAKAYAKAVEGLQEVLGEHQDSVVVREVLHRLAGRDPQALAFTCGRLFAAEVGHAAASREAVDAAWEAASSRKLRRWLR
ncbi:CYTH and CHAD domain-containing protein [Paenibacillus sp. TRM 82003]|uniref:CYTH and CHAD domain-containing protein n=1 Tax=Kineococcus sp. TRM81007 TaxID=2925831 RepID=UPI001F596437|nr:CYTH and CHAD domain-containing protein [Kineococcus sp. TRM81007]MCI2239936.1 CYTH and CHAD domain-containing protein [Kineococcus sp. TRM81007]MCI3925759.1 CYTH and CHAD domain-containing protein [Paenibacillus sp. TRM 82003]